MLITKFVYNKEEGMGHNWNFTFLLLAAAVVSLTLVDGRSGYFNLNNAKLIQITFYKLGPKILPT